MTQTTRPLDPEIQALLEKVAKDPRSHLLRVPEVCVPLTVEAPVMPSAAFLSSAERRILQVYRAEVAQLLVEAAQLSVVDGLEAVGQFHRQTTIEQTLRLPDTDDWQRRAGIQLERSPEEVQATEGYSLLERCVVSTPGTRPSAVQMATASLRLVPRVETRIWLAYALYQADEIGNALNLLYEVISTGPSHLNASLAWEAAAFFEWQRGNEASSLHACCRASASLEHRSFPVMSWLVTALQLGDRHAAVTAAERLDELVSHDHPSIDEYGRLLRQRKRLGSWVATREFVRLHRGLGDRLPAAAARVVNAALDSDDHAIRRGIIVLVACTMLPWEGGVVDASQVTGPPTAAARTNSATPSAQPTVKGGTTPPAP